MIICEKHSPCTRLHTHGAKARGSRFGVKNKAFNLNCLGDPRTADLGGRLCHLKTYGSGAGARLEQVAGLGTWLIRPLTGGGMVQGR